jgi:predicted DNA-binding transcriptional regulator YafY
VAKGSVWYLVAAIDGDIRTYRIARILGAYVTEHPCQRPQDFDLAAHWERSSADFRANLPRYPATLRAHETILPALHAAAIGKWARIEHVEPPAADGWARVAMLFEEEHYACEYVLSFGPRIEVLEPGRLRDLVIEAAEGIVALYGRHL